MVNESDVQMAYRLFHGREPESASVVAEMAKSNPTLAELRRGFLISDEFRRLIEMPLVPTLKPLTWPPNHVEVLVTADRLQGMISRVEKQFQFLGETEPYWSVLTADRYRMENFSEHDQEFYESGKHDVDALLATASRCDVDLATTKSCLELGCGVGRSSLWLAEHFETVTGVDISPLHLGLAQTTLKRYKKENVRLLHFGSVDQIADFPDFDFFFSIIVLQHNPPPVIYRILQLIFEKLKPGGLAYFQVPTYGFGYQFVPQEYLSTTHDLAHPEMHVLPQPILLKLLAESRCQLIEIREDGASGPSFISNRILARKAPR